MKLLFFLGRDKTFVFLNVHILQTMFALCMQTFVWKLFVDFIGHHTLGTSLKLVAGAFHFHNGGKFFI